jgi:RimJ/RimL family protein N-acetyltransferase
VKNQTALEIIDIRHQKLTDSEIRAVAEIEEHPEIGKWDIPACGGDVEKAFAGFKKYLDHISGNEFLVAKLDGRVAGFATIHRIEGEIGEMSHVGEISIAVHPDFQRKGIGTELLRSSVNLAKARRFERLEADILAHNKAAVGLFKKGGFKLEGTRKKRVRVDEEYYDEACYALLI